MKSYSVEAIVLRMQPLGEADRILTLFSRERGKLRAVAKGVRRTQSKFGARLDFFSRANMALHTGRNLDVITSAASIAGVWEALVDPDVYAFVSYVAEVVDGLSEPGLPVPEVYDLLCEIEGVLADGRAKAEMEPVESRAARDLGRVVESLRPVFDLKLLAALGFGIGLDACARCGTPLGRRPFAGGRAALSPEAGGLVCRRCLDLGSGDEDDTHRTFTIVRTTPAEFELLRRATDVAFTDALEEPELGRLARITQAFVQYQLGHSSRALAATHTQRARTKPDAAVARR